MLGPLNVKKALSTVASLFEERLAVGGCLGVILNTSL
jgi:hypothetical protein